LHPTAVAAAATCKVHVLARGAGPVARLASRHATGTTTAATASAVNSCRIILCRTLHTTPMTVGATRKVHVLAGGTGPIARSRKARQRRRTPTASATATATAAVLLIAIEGADLHRGELDMQQSALLRARAGERLLVEPAQRGRRRRWVVVQHRTFTFERAAILVHVAIYLGCSVAIAGHHSDLAKVLRDLLLVGLLGKTAHEYLHIALAGAWRKSGAVRGVRRALGGVATSGRPTLRVGSRCGLLRG